MLRKREKPTENLALAGIGSAILAVFSLLIAFFPSLSIVLIFLLPLVSVLVGYLCESRYLIPYVIASSFVSYLVASFNPLEVLFSVLPSILTGTLFGFLLQRKLGIVLPLFLVSFLQFAIDYAVIGILKAGFNLDPVETFRTLLGIPQSPTFQSWVPAALYGVSFGQSLISFVLMVFFWNDLFKERIGRWPRAILLTLVTGGLLSIALCLSLGPYEGTSAHFFFLLSFALSIGSLFAISWQGIPWWIYLVSGILMLLALLLRAMLGPHYPESLLLNVLFCLPFLLMSLWGSLLPKGRKEDPRA